MYEDNSNKLASSSSSPMSSGSSSPEVQATKQQQQSLVVKTEAPYSSSCSTSLDDLDDLTDLLQIPPSEFAMEDLGDLFGVVGGAGSSTVVY